MMEVQIADVYGLGSRWLKVPDDGIRNRRTYGLMMIGAVTIQCLNRRSIPLQAHLLVMRGCEVGPGLRAKAFEPSQDINITII